MVGAVGRGGARLLHALAAALKAGVWPPPGAATAILMLRPSGDCWTTGSGKSGTPWLRMHAANLSKAASAGPPGVVPEGAAAVVVAVVDPRLATRGVAPLLQATVTRAS